APARPAVPPPWARPLEAAGCRQLLPLPYPRRPPRGPRDDLDVAALSMGRERAATSRSSREAGCRSLSGEGGHHAAAVVGGGAPGGVQGAGLADPQRQVE